MRAPVVILFSLAPLLGSAVQLFKTPGDIPEAVPVRCCAALAQNITCSPLLITGQKAANGDHLSGSDLTTYCSSDCNASIKKFQTAVESACGKSSYSLYPNVTSTQVPLDVANGILWAYNLVCIKDESGFCIADYYQDKKTDCSDCALKYGAVMLGSDYGRVRYREDLFTSILASCSAPASKYPWSYTPTQGSGSTSTTTSTTAPTASCMGRRYTVKQGDTCQSISKANSIGTDRMIDENHLDYNCNTLSVGSTLCLMNQCKTVVIEKSQTCDSITKGQSYDVYQLQAWNPSLKNVCDTKILENLDSLAGRAICVSPPGGGDVPTIGPPTTSWTPTSIESPIFTSWRDPVTTQDAPNTTTSWYYPTFNPSYTAPIATETVDPEQVQHQKEQTKYCWITHEDEQHLFNPEDQPAGCQALLSTYCYPEPTQAIPTAPPKVPTVCTPDRSLYNWTAPTPIVTPTPHQPNLTLGCAKFYFVKPNDGCAAVANAQGVALTDFYKWNPDVGTECKGLQAGTYVCVAYDPNLLWDTDPNKPDKRGKLW